MPMDVSAVQGYILLLLMIAFVVCCVVWGAGNVVMTIGEAMLIVYVLTIVCGTAIGIIGTPISMITKDDTLCQGLGIAFAMFILGIVPLMIVLMIGSILHGHGAFGIVRVI